MPEKENIEKEYQKLVKRCGGYRKNLSQSQRKEADRLAGLLGCNIRDGWEESTTGPTDDLSQKRAVNMAKRQ